MNFFDTRRFDRFLFAAAAAVVLCLIIIKLSAGAASDKVVLFVSREWEQFLGKELTETLIREFEETNSGIRIKLIPEIPSGKNPAGPDLFVFDEGAFSSLVKAGSLAPLSSYVSNESRTEQYAIPLFAYMDLLFYNIEMLKAAGFDRPPKTRNEFLACAKAVSAEVEAGAYGTALSLHDEDPLALQRDVLAWFGAAGGDFGMADKPQFNGRTAVDTLAFLGRLYSEGALAPNSFDTTGVQRLKDFESGKVAMITASSKEIPAMRKKMGDGFGITVIPGSEPPAKNAAVFSRVYAGISAESGRQDEAWTFLVFLAGHTPLFAAKIPGAVSERYDGNDPLYAKVRDIFEAAEEVWGLSGNPKRNEYERAMREALRVFLEQNKNPADTAAAIQAQWELAGN